jgi:hypothetical protein
MFFLPRSFVAGIVSLGVVAGWVDVAAMDSLDDARRIEGLSGSDVGTTEGAGFTPDEPAVLSGLQSIWWVWTAPETGVVTFDAEGSDAEEVGLACFEGENAAALRSVKVDLTGLGDPDHLPMARFLVQQGQTIWIALVTMPDGTGEVTLRWNLEAIVYPEDPALPAMVYRVKATTQTEGVSAVSGGQEVSWPRVQRQVVNGLLVRGRDEGAFIESDLEGRELAPMTVFWLYSRKEGGLTRKTFVMQQQQVLPMLDDDEDDLDEEGEWVAPLATRLTRHARSASGYAESFQLAIRPPHVRAASTAVGTGVAVRRSPTSGHPRIWFASRITARQKGSWIAADQDVADFTAAEPLPGLVESSTYVLSFNGRDTNSVSGLSYLDAVEAIRNRLLAEGRVEEPEL